MKLLAVALLAAIPALSGELYRHIQTPLLDCYIDSSVTYTPPIPGAEGAEYFLVISVGTTDFSASAFVVYGSVEMEDGSRVGFRRVIEKSPIDAPVVARFLLGGVRPVSVSRFYVVRLHQEPADLLITPRPR
jgi:hypothetical protein